MTHSAEARRDETALGGPTIGIVVICRNNADGLRRTVASIVCQNRAPDAVEIVDGASTDGTVEWQSSAALPAYVRFASEADRGIYDALNKGVARLHTDLVLFTNAGDQLADAATLRAIEESFVLHEWQWSYGDTRVEQPTGEYMGRNELKFLARARFVSGFTAVPHQGTVMRRSLIEEVGPFREDIGPSADQEHLFRAWQHSAPWYLHRDIGVFDPTGVSSTSAPGAFAVQMRSHRRMHGYSIGGSATLDAVCYFAAKQISIVRDAVARRRLSWRMQSGR